MGSLMGHLPNLWSLFFGNSPPTLCLGTHGPLGLFPVSISLHDFNTHLYVVGQSGQGKSKFLQQLLFQLATSGWGCGVFDPHSDLAQDLLAQLASYPRHRPWLSQRANYQRVIYVDPARSDFILPCNILKSTTSSPYSIAENVVEAFRRVWPDTLYEAPRFAQILRNAIVVLIANDLTLLELEPLLTDSTFRRRLLAQVTDPLITSFFTQQYDRWRSHDQALFISPVLNKITAFLFQPQVRLMLGATENRLDFRTILDEGKMLIINLGSFKDEETQRLLGSLFLTSLEQAAFSRSDQPASSRRPFFCMVDEFPLFCSRDATSLARILSECRKYRLHLGLAHQTITQLPGERIQGALENAKLKVVFGTGRQTAQAIVGDLFLPDPQAVKHEVADETAQERSHPLYSQLTEQFELFVQAIQKQHVRHALVKLPSAETPQAVRTLDVPPSRVSRTQLLHWMVYLAKQAGRPRQELEKAQQHRLHAHPATQARQDPDEFWYPEGEK
jgi:hypothetical protein